MAEQRFSVPSPTDGGYAANIAASEASNQIQRDARTAPKTRSRLGACPHDSLSTARGAELVQNSEGQLIKIPPARIGLSTSSVYPESTSSAFEPRGGWVTTASRS